MTKEGTSGQPFWKLLWRFFKIPKVELAANPLLNTFKGMELVCGRLEYSPWPVLLIQHGRVWGFALQEACFSLPFFEKLLSHGASSLCHIGGLCCKDGNLGTLLLCESQTVYAPQTRQSAKEVKILGSDFNCVNYLHSVAGTLVDLICRFLK